MKWTKERPTQTGWYWAVLDHPNQVVFDCERITLVRVEERPDDDDYFGFYDHVCFWLVHGEVHCFNFSMWTHWMGPIPVPEMPNNENTEKKSYPPMRQRSAFEYLSLLDMHLRVEKARQWWPLR